MLALALVFVELLGQFRCLIGIFDGDVGRATEIKVRLCQRSR